MVYFSFALLVAAVLLAFVHIREQRDRPLKSVALWVIVVLIASASVATTVQVYRIGDSGAKATWGRQASVTQ